VSGTCWRRSSSGWAAHDTLDRLPEITVPTLVVAGEADLACPPRYGRIVAERIPGAELVVLPGEAHQPFQERPAEFNALVDAWGALVDAWDERLAAHHHA